MNENNSHKYYNIEDIKSAYNKENISPFNRYINSNIFKLKLFRNLNKIYFKRTPESDSLYRRRNRLIIMLMSTIFYFQTSTGIFSRIELDIYASKTLLRKTVILPLILY